MTFAGHKVTGEASAEPASSGAKPLFSAPTKEHPVFGNASSSSEPKKQEDEKPKSLFAPSDAAKTSFAFSQQPATEAASSGSLFGNKTSLFSAPASAPEPAKNLFGSSAPAEGGKSLFGNAPPATTSLFGTSAPAEGAKSLFGSTPAAPTTGGLFGNASAPSGGLFGNTTQPAAGSLFAPGPSSLFGKPAAGQPSLFASGNLFAKPAETNKDENNDEDDGPIKADDEPPSYQIDG